MAAPAPTPATLTSAQYERLARAGLLAPRLELRRGMLVRLAPQFVPHALLKMRLAEGLKAAVASRGWLVLQEVSVDFAEGFQPMPDIVVWDPALAPPDLDGPVPGGAVQLVVEVAGASLAEDLGDKLADYAAAGLKEYWVADVKGRLILRHADPENGDYRRRESALLGADLPWLTQPLLVDGRGL